MIEIMSNQKTNIKLQSIKIKNFKGLKSFECDFDSETTIKGQNGTGKTSIYDAFLWLMFGKDSAGKKDFQFRPVDKDNQPIGGLSVEVEAVMMVNSKTVRLTRCHEENVVKKELRGFTTGYHINEVPKKAGEYAAYIAKLIPEDTFKLLADIKVFNVMHWSGRRLALIDIAGDIVAPEGYESLLEAAGDESLDDYKKVLADRKKKLITGRGGINPRIDELQMSLDGYVDTDMSSVTAQRDKVSGELAATSIARKALTDSEGARQKQIEAVNALTTKKNNLEMDIDRQCSAENPNMKKIGELEIDLCNKSTFVNKLRVKLQAAEDAKKISLARSIQVNSQLEECRKEYTKCNAPVDDICFNCEQKLPEDKQAGALARQKIQLQAVDKRGAELSEQLKLTTDEIRKNDSDIALITLDLKESQAAMTAAQEAAQQIPALREVPYEAPNYESNPEWRTLSQQIEAYKAAIGEPISDQLTELDAERTVLNDELTKLNSHLAQSDQMAAAKKRIEELEAREKVIGCQIAQIDGEIAEIGEYRKAESAIITEAVNCRFSHVEFKLFKELLNGSVEDCCETVFHGVAYNELSTGEKIFVGIDIINTLSEHYGLNVPLFIDNAESYTLESMPIEGGQIIKLFADAGVKTLTIEGK